LESKTANIYNTIAILAKRSNQISLEIREELLAKLAEFATVNDSIEEIFENREQNRNLQNSTKNFRNQR